MPRIVLFGLIVWFAVVFGLRTWLHWRSTGRTGWVGFSGSAGSLEWWAGIAFVAAILLGVSAPVQAIVAETTDLGGPLQHVVGLVLFVAGAAFTLVAQLSMGDSWRIGVDAGERTALVSSGPFEWVRNPIFSAMLLTSLGMLLLVPTLLSLLAFVVLVGALELQVRFVEEPYLLRTHGEEYRRYLGRVGRFVPGVGRIAVPASAGERVVEARS